MSTMQTCRSCGRVLVQGHKCAPDNYVRRTTARKLPATAKPHDRRTVGERAKAYGPKLPKGVKTYRVEADTVVEVLKDYGKSKEPNLGHLTKNGKHVLHHKRITNPMPTTAPRWPVLDKIEAKEDRRRQAKHKANLEIADLYELKAQKRRESARLRREGKL